MIKIHKTTWKTYLKFVHLCSVPTMPFHGGPCWITNDKSAFIGYNYPFRNNRLRFRAMPLLLKMSKRKQALFLQKNMLCLNRILVKPEFRNQGIATEIIKTTLPLTKRPIIECITSTPQICKMLTTAGFKCYGWSKEKGYYYYLFYTQVNLDKFVANWFINSEKRREKQGIPTEV
jgi:GNAT superfamily N-acetyltransferase